MFKLFFQKKIKNSWSKLSIRHKGIAVIVLPLICLFGSLSTFSWLRYTLSNAQDWVDHTDTILLKSRQLYTHLLTAESTTRAYSISCDPEFIEPYRSTQATVNQDLSELKLLVADNEIQLKRVMQMQLAAQGKIDALDQIITASNCLDSSRKQDIALVYLLKKGVARMDSFRVILTEFETEERRLLKDRQADLNQRWKLMDFTFQFAFLVSGLASFIALALFSKVEKNLRDREQNLNQSRTLLQAVTNNVIDGVIILNLKGEIAAFNQACVQMFGYEVSEIMGENISILLNDPLTEGCSNNDDQPVSHLLRVGHRWQTLGCKKGKETFPIELSVSQLAINSGDMIAILRDMTQQQEAEAQLQARAEELSHLNRQLSIANLTLLNRNRELDQFAYVASHDLKAPLRAIANLSEWIEEDLTEQLSVENQEQMQLLRARVRRMDALIDGLLNYSRVGRVQMEFERVDVQDLLAEVIDTLDPPEEFKINIESEMPILTTRRILLKQVFSNLIDNAIRHHPHRNGTITISGEDRDGDFEFAVQDDGGGIEPQYHEKIFLIFQTLQPRDTHESTGIGLSIVKKIIEAEGGTIRIESHAGAGATFRFTWPTSPNR